MKVLASLLVCMLCAGAAAATPSVSVTPLHTEGSLAKYPRLASFLDASIQQKVNAMFAAREASAREDRDGCFDLVREAGREPGDALFEVRMDVRYVSERYLSLEARRSYDCAGAHPNDGVLEPLTINLATGAEIDWSHVFEPEFLPREDGSEGPVHLHDLYRAHYAKEGNTDSECVDVVKESLSTMFLWLDARFGLMVEPDFPHAIRACADTIALSPAELAPYVADAKFLADLRATVKGAP